MLSVKQRGATYRLEGKFFSVYLRISLGTRNGSHAEKLLNLIHATVREGIDSEKWSELKRQIPEEAFARLSKLAGFVERPTPPSPPPPKTWEDLVESFTTEVKHRIAIGKFCQSTLARYGQTMNAFTEFLKENQIAALNDITKPAVEVFKSWRMTRILARRGSKGGRGLALDVAILHRIFAHAMECELIVKNPVRLEGKPGDNPEVGAQPFTASQLEKLREASGADRLSFLLLRHTGLRGSDAVSLKWHEVDWQTREINRITQKRSKRVIVPIYTELLFELEATRQERQPMADHRVLLNPITGRAMTRPRLYERMMSIGRRAGIPNANPHRFRDTFAVDMLAKGASPYDVAKLLGDTIETVERHYAPFVKELRERARRIMENGNGLESRVENCTVFAHRTANDDQVQ